MEIHGAPLDTCAVHEHPAGAVTVTTASLTFSWSNVCCVGLIEYVHVGAAALCDTVTDCPAMVNVVVRASPVFAATLNTTEPLPDTLADGLTVTHDTAAAAVHAQCAAVVTVTVFSPPALPSENVVGLTANAHAAAA
jgi:hypothetical protein